MAIKKTKFKIEAENKTDKAFRKINGDLGRMKGAVSSLLGPLAAVAGVAGMLSFTRNTLDAADAIGKFADRAGVTTDALQEMQFAFDIAGVAETKFQKGLLTFGKRVGKARADTGALAEGLKKLDQTLLDNVLSTDTTQEALDVIFSAMEKATSATERLAIADAAFGTAGLRMTAAFSDAAGSFAEFRKQARDLDFVIEEDLIRNAEALNDAFLRSSRAVKVSFQRSLLELAPTLSAIADFIAFNMPKALKIMRQGIAVVTQAIVFMDVQLNKTLNLERIQRLETLQRIIRERVNSGQSFTMLQRTAVALQNLINTTQRGIEEQEKFFDLLVQQEIPFAENISDFRKELTNTGMALSATAAEIDKFRTSAEEFMKIDLKDTIKVSPEALATMKEFVDEINRQKEAFDRVVDPAKEINKEISSLQAIKHLIPPEAMIAFEEDLKRLRGEAKALREELDPEAQAKTKKIADDKAKALARENAVLKSLKDPLDELAALEVILDMKLEAGTITALDHADAIERLEKQYGLFEKEVDPMIAALDRIASGLEQNFTDALFDAVTGTGNLQDSVKSMVDFLLKELLRLQFVRPFIENLFGESGSGGGLLGAVLGGLKSFGGGGGSGGLSFAGGVGGFGTEFAHGGSGIVGGVGPTDSKSVRLKVTPGEKITVQTPQQQRQGSGGIVINQNFSLGVKATVRAEMVRLMPAMSRNIRADLVKRQAKGAPA